MLEKRIEIVNTISRFMEDNLVPNFKTIRNNVNMTTPTLIKNINILLENRVLSKEIRGRNIYYSLTKKGKDWKDKIKESEDIYKGDRK